MEACEYQKLAEYEGWYWWYCAQREILSDAVSRLELSSGARLLDAGCGSGRSLIELARSVGVAPYGVDRSVHAAALWKKDDDVSRCLASINELPYADGIFDVAVSVDVLGCEGVAARAAVGEMARVVRHSGWVVILVPAYQWLLSSHDRAVHSVQRFNRRQIRCLLQEAGLSVERLTHLFPTFFPIVALTRLVRKVGSNGHGTATRSDLSPLPRWANRTLLAAARAEHRLLRRLAVPFGSTVLAVGRKVGR